MTSSYHSFMKRAARRWLRRQVQADLRAELNEEFKSLQLDSNELEWLESLDFFEDDFFEDDFFEDDFFEDDFSADEGDFFGFDY